MEDEQANNEAQTRLGVVLLLNGMQFGPTPLVLNPLGVTLQGSATIAPKIRGGKPREITTERLIPWTAIVSLDFLPDEEEAEG